ncbi:darcynin family protein [uncultured Pseudonocardia sp.]|nr:darcynin family protein [uncultured Pseudonocardia sp.]
MRETPFWDTFFEVVEIVPMIEDGYATQYRVDPV